jgi:hypothetical protein
MKSMFLRWSAILSLVGSTLIGPAMLRNMSALAIPEANVLQKLQAVPVYTIGSSQGGLLTASVPAGQGANAGKKVSVSRVFINQQDAQSFLDKVKGQNPAIAKDMRVLPIPLSEIYKLSKQNSGKPEPLVFEFVPRQEEVNAALSLLKQQGKEINTFNGVPLFVARGGPENGYLIFQKGQQEALLLFFNKADLQGMVDQFKKAQPNSASTISIEVTTLLSVIEDLVGKNEPLLNKIEFVPPPESRDLIRQLMQKSGNNGAPGAPATQPKP